MEPIQMVTAKSLCKPNNFPCCCCNFRSVWQHCTVAGCNCNCIGAIYFQFDRFFFSRAYLRFVMLAAARRWGVGGPLLAKWWREAPCSASVEKSRSSGGFNKLFKLTRLRPTVRPTDHQLCGSVLRVGGGVCVNGRCLPTVCGRQKRAKKLKEKITSHAAK